MQQALLYRVTRYCANVEKHPESYKSEEKI